MSKHTPGPWEISFSPQKTPDDYTTGYEREWVYISGPAHIDLATAVWRIDGERSETCEANARLIAAAPEMLEAIEAAIASGMVPGESITSGPGTKTQQGKAAAMLRAAIAKAKGE